MARTQVNMSASDAAAKWAQRTKNAVADTQKGVDAVTDSPMEMAAAKQDKMLAGITDAINSGRWANGLKKVSLSEWKQKTKDKLAQRLPGGVDAALSKRQAFDEHNINVINAGLPKVHALPDLTMEDSVARVRFWMEHMKQNRYKK